MPEKHPILIIIPHGGYTVPEELAGLEAVSEFDLFVQADTCANDLFRFGDRVIASIDATVSRLFIDLDRSYQDISTVQSDGVIKIKTLFGKDTFQEGAFPDEIAIANMLKRYYFPFHETVEKIISSGEIKAVVECHTQLPVGPQACHDAGKPRATVNVANKAIINDDSFTTCDDDVARLLIDSVMKQLAQEDQSVVPSAVTHAPPRSFLIRKYGLRGIPYLRLSLSKSLFLNDRDFSHDYLRVDELRIIDLRERLWKGIERWYARYRGDHPPK